MNNVQVETRAFSESELKLFTRKHKAYLEAAAGVNEVIEFLKDQHNIDPADGWQLGEGCFVRQATVQDKPRASVPAPVNRTQERQRRAKKMKAATADLPPLAQGENAAAVAQNGQLATEPVL